MRQFGWLTAGRATASAFSFLWLAIAARSLSVAEFADLALVLAVGAIFSVVADFGMPLVLNEAVAAEPDRGRASLVLVIRRRMALAVVAASAMSGLYLLAANAPMPAVPAVFAVSMAASAWHTSCAAALRGGVSVVPDATNEMLSRLVVLVAGGFLVSNGAGVLAAVAVYAAADLLSAVALTAAAWRLLPADRPADRGRFRLGRMVPLGLASVAGIAYYRLDVWLLALFSSAGEVARYSVSYRILDVIVMPAGALAVVTIGATARLGHASAVRKADRMAGIMCVCAVPAVLLLEALPGPLLRMAFGEVYVAGVSVLRILALAVVPSVASLVWGTLLALRHKGVLAVTLGSLVANVALNLVLIPHLGAAGAAAATVVGQVGYAGALRLRLRDLVSGDRSGEPPVPVPAHTPAGPA